jgi:mannose-1-phosphate guanylyltransferase/phosphomannomutase
VFPHLLADRTAFHVWRLQTYWNDIGSIGMYRRGNFDALQARVAVEIPGRELRLGVWIGKGTHVADHVVIVPPVLIGNGCRVESGARLIGPLIIGDNCSIGHDAVLEGVIHWDGSMTDDRASISGGIVGRGVQVRGGATVHRGAVIGDGCVIRARAVVKPDARLRPHTVVDRDAVP